MKQLILLLSISLSAVVCFGQKDTIRLKRTASENKVIVTDRAPQAVYFQLGGSGPVLSVNYDRRFGKKVNGAGFAAGVGFWGGSGDAYFSIPVSINYLFGRRSDFIEAAGGATFLTGSSDSFFSDSRSTTSEIFYHINLGYRHQPAVGGFFFRGGLSPIFSGSEYLTWFYIGFGYNF